MSKLQALSPSEGERENRRQVSCKPRFRGRVAEGRERGGAWKARRSPGLYVFGGWRESVFKPSTLRKKLEKTVWMETTISVTAGSNRRMLSP